MYHRLALVCLLSLLVVVAAIPGPAMSQSTPDASDAPDNTIIHVYVHENGTAEWVFKTRTRLSNQSDIESFEQFKQDYEANSTAQLDSFRERMSDVAANAENSTNREMAVRAFETRAFVQEVPRRWGVVEFRFRWDGFAEQGTESLSVGDVFAGGWLLSEGDSLVIHAPNGYTATSVSPSPDTSDSATRLIWEGSVAFADGRPEVVFSPVDTIDVATPPSTENRSISFGIFFGGIAVLAVVIFGTTTLYLKWRPHDEAEADTSVVTDSAPMTDSERVLDLIHKNGGRMKQADIDAQFDWSKSKTSLVISELAEEGRVTKVRLGRENLITLVGDDEN